MKRGFTLLELIIVIIIIGILATLGLTQYAKVIEKSRGAEARGILGDLRKLAAAYRLERGTFTVDPYIMSDSDLGLGIELGDIPLDGGAGVGCRVSHYFKYSFDCAADPECTFTATRCDNTETGKNPPGPTLPAPGTLTLTTNFSTGVDIYASNVG